MLQFCLWFSYLRDGLNPLQFWYFGFSFHTTTQNKKHTPLCTYTCKLNAGCGFTSLKITQQHLGIFPQGGGA